MAVSLAFGLAVVGPADPARAQEKTWGSANATAWTTAGNWSPSGIPAASNWINFSGSDANPGTGMQVNFGNTAPAGVFEVQSIRWNRTTNNNVGSNASTAGVLRLDGPGGSNPFTSLVAVDNTGNFVVQPLQGGSGALTFQLNANGTLGTSNTGGLVVAANVTETGGARNLTVSGTSAAATGTINSSSFGARDGTYNGAVVITGAGSYTGTTSVSAGYLGLGNLNAVQTSSAVTVSTGAQAQLNVAAGGTYVVGAGTLTLNGAGPATAGNPGALLVGNNVTSGTTHTINNPIALASDATINARGGSNVLVLGGNLSGNGGLIKQGGGRLDVGGVAVGKGGSEGGREGVGKGSGVLG